MTYVEICSFFKYIFITDFSFNSIMQSDNILCIVKFLKSGLVLWPKWWLILVNVPRAVGKHLPYATVWVGVFYTWHLGHVTDGLVRVSSIVPDSLSTFLSLGKQY